MKRRPLALLLLLLLVGFVSRAEGQAGGPPPEQRVISVAPAGTPAYGQIAVSTTATLIRPANANRSTITLVNHGTTAVYIGTTNAVTTTTGALLVGVPGSQFLISTRTDIWAVASGATQTVGFIEEIR